MNCPVLQECAEYAVVWEEWGFWGRLATNDERYGRSKESCCTIQVDE